MKTVLRVKGLRKEFGGLVAVEDVSFEISPGEFVHEEDVFPMMLSVNISQGAGCVRTGDTGFFRG